MLGHVRALRLLVAIILISMGLISSAAAIAAADRILVNVGGDTVTEKQLKKYMDVSKVTDEKEALQELVTRSILYQEARKLGLDRKEEIKERLAEVKRNILIQALLAEKSMTDEPVTEDKARELYEKNWMDSRYPRWVGITLIKISYKKGLEKEAGEYAKKLRLVVDSAEFEKDYKAALENLKKKMPPPEGIDLIALNYKKVFLLKFRQFKSDLEDIALKLKKGETSEPIKAPQGQPGYALLNLTTEYPKEEIGFQKVMNDLMLSASAMMQKEKMKSYYEKMKGEYKIEYFLK